MLEEVQLGYNALLGSTTMVGHFGKAQTEGLVEHEDRIQGLASAALEDHEARLNAYLQIPSGVALLYFFSRQTFFCAQQHQASRKMSILWNWVLPKGRCVIFT